MKLVSLLNPDDFGAVGDGIADDTEAVERMMNELAALAATDPHGASLCALAPGYTYRLTRPIVISCRPEAR